MISHSELGIRHGVKYIEMYLNTNTLDGLWRGVAWHYLT